MEAMTADEAREAAAKARETISKGCSTDILLDHISTLAKKGQSRFIWNATQSQFKILRQLGYECEGTTITWGKE